MTQNALSAYLDGVYAPVRDEGTDTRLTVLGAIPTDICGAYVQNNPNPRFAPKGLYHWFDGDGMIHGVQLQAGEATYRNRYVRTAGFE